MRVRVHHVTSVDMRKNELTNYKLLSAAIRKTMRPMKDAVVMRNTAGTLVRFVWKPEKRDRGDGIEVEVVGSMTLRLAKYRSWDPMMLSEYAADLGLEVIGGTRLKELLKRRKR